MPRGSEELTNARKQEYELWCVDLEKLHDDYDQMTVNDFSDKQKEAMEKANANYVFLYMK